MSKVKTTILTAIMGILPGLPPAAQNLPAALQNDTYLKTALRRYHLPGNQEKSIRRICITGQSATEWGGLWHQIVTQYVPGRIACFVNGPFSSIPRTAPASASSAERIPGWRPGSWSHSDHAGYRIAAHSHARCSSCI